MAELVVGGEYDFASADDPHSGSAAISAAAGTWGALSLYRDGGLGGAELLRFWFRGDPAPVHLILEDDGAGTASDPVLLSDHLGAGAGWRLVEVPLALFGAGAWTRIDWTDGGGFGASFELDDVELIDEVPEPPAAFSAAEPVGARRVMVLGNGDVDAIEVTLQGAPIAVTGSVSAADPERVYLDLADPLDVGELVVATADGSFTRELRQLTAAVDSPDEERPISPLIYGMALPSVDMIGTHGVAVARWGGNAATRHNPFLPATNRGADWFFENGDSADEAAWIATVQDAGAAALLTVPALGWVSRDTTSYSYPVSVYGPQQATDPWNSDAGNGIDADGDPILADPERCCTPWSDTARSGDPPGTLYADEWLAGLPDPPDLVAIDNEIDIASETHRDVHPDPATYDELAETFLRYGTSIREVLPSTAILGPVSCCWWFYWNSAAGSADKAAHGEQDFLPWFLEQAAQAEADSGTRILDYLDIHYYPSGLYNDDADPETQALRLRSTRGLWDPSYTDEGWIGTDESVTATQPNPNEVQLLPRMKALIEAHYPGTRLALTEWNFGTEETVAGGLAVADVLGIFGRHGLDLATYRSHPPSGSPAAAAFRLYREPGDAFGELSLDVDAPEPDLLGLYAASRAQDEITLVALNKDPDRDLVLDVEGLPPGSVSLRRFGGALGGDIVADPEGSWDGRLVVPAYGAVFVAIRPAEGDDDDAGDDDTGGDDDEAPDDDDAANDDDVSEGTASGCSGCRSATGGDGWPLTLVLLALTWRTRRRPANR